MTPTVHYIALIASIYSSYDHFPAMDGPAGLGISSQQSSSGDTARINLIFPEEPPPAQEHLRRGAQPDQGFFSNALPSFTSTASSPSRRQSITCRSIETPEINYSCPDDLNYKVLPLVTLSSLQFLFTSSIAR